MTATTDLPQKTIYWHNVFRCRRKVSYSSPAKARKHRRRWAFGGGKDVYHCKYCGMWHLGSRNNDD